MLLPPPGMLVLVHLPAEYLLVLTAQLEWNLLFSSSSGQSERFSCLSLFLECMVLLCICDYILDGLPGQTGKPLRANPGMELTLCLLGGQDTELFAEMK